MIESTKFRNAAGLGLYKRDKMDAGCSPGRRLVLRGADPLTGRTLRRKVWFVELKKRCHAELVSAPHMLSMRHARRLVFGTPDARFGWMAYTWQTACPLGCRSASWSVGMTSERILDVHLSADDPDKSGAAAKIACGGRGDNLNH